ncbi:ROK family protein [Elusimicrobiota bacterium]
MRSSIGIDIGATVIKAGIVDAKGSITHEISMPTPRHEPEYVTINLMAEAIAELKKIKPSIRSLGIAFAGDVNPDTGFVRNATNLGWKNFPLTKKLRKKIGSMNIFIDNDANCAAWAAYWVMNKKRGPVKNIVCLTLGSGIGGGIVIDGDILHGISHTAGEIGHLVVEPNGRKCICGRRGCVEAYTGGINLVKRAQEKSKKRIMDLTPRKIAEMARRGDKMAIKLWKSYGHYLGRAIANAVNLINPQWIVLTGGIAKARDLFLPELKSQIKLRSFPPAVSSVRIYVLLRKDLGVLGAGLLSLEKSFKK